MKYKKSVLMNLLIYSSIYLSNFNATIFLLNKHLTTKHQILYLILYKRLLQYLIQNN